MAGKLHSNLAGQIRRLPSSTLVDVVVELRREDDSAPEPATAASGLQSRAEQVAAKKASFERSFAGVAEAVREAGGEITGQAWVNQTLRARVPAGKVRDLCRNDGVAAVDAPSRLTPEGG